MHAMFKCSIMNFKAYILHSSAHSHSNYIDCGGAFKNSHLYIFLPNEFASNPPKFQCNEQYLVTSWIIFLWLLLALQVKVGKVASFTGKIFLVRASTMKTTNVLSHENYQLYGSNLRYIGYILDV